VNGPHQHAGQQIADQRRDADPLDQRAENERQHETDDNR
jgi:hypothetical protein